MATRSITMGLAGLALVVFLLPASPAPAASPAAASTFWRGVAGEVGQALDQAVALLASGQREAADEAVNVAYFDRFEEKRMEGALRKEMGIEHIALVEARFAKLHDAIEAGDSRAATAWVKGLKIMLAKDGAALDKLGVPEAVYDLGK